MEITRKELNNMLEEHKQWLNDPTTGKRLEFHGDLRGCDLSWFNLRRSDLSWSDLREADLHGADLRGTDLQGANLEGANIDFSCWPLWCGSGNVKLDDRQVAQLINHILAVDHPLARKLRQLKTVTRLSDKHPASEGMWCKSEGVK